MRAPLITAVACAALTAVLSGCQTPAPKPCVQSVKECAIQAFKPNIPLIMQKVRSNWAVPDVAPGLSNEVKLTLGPDGTVLTAVISKSSGSAELDTSVLSAIRASSPFPYPDETSYHEYLRELVFNFEPPKR